MKPDITAVVCTYNRAPYLRDCLASLRRQTLPHSSYEVLVIDNSPDETARRVVADYQRGLPNLHYLHEPRGGLSNARNKGLRHANGPFIAYIDDDAVADADWLENALLICEPRCDTLGILGGLVRPVFETPRPAWLTDDLLPFLSMTTLGNSAADMTGRIGLVGANMVFCTDALRDVGAFSAGLGRQGPLLMSNEELHAQHLLEAEGLQSIYDPSVAVSHHVIRARVTKRWFRHRLYWQGRSDAVLWRAGRTPNAAEYLSEFKRASALLVKHFAHRSRLPVPRVSRESPFSSECHMISRVGYLVGLVHPG